MAKATFVKKARKDIAGTNIKKGDSYYWWKFRYGSKQVSKMHPKRSQLTQSEFLSTIFDIEDTISNISADDNFEGEIESITGELADLKSECEERLENMPEHLQETSSSGELLQERIDMLEEMTDELESVDIDIDTEKEEYETDDEYNDRIEESKEEILSNIQTVAYNGS